MWGTFHSPRSRLFLLLVSLATVTGGCDNYPVVCNLVPLRPAVKADVWTSDGRRAAAGAWLIVTAGEAVDTGWAAPEKSARYIWAGERAVPRVDARVEKPWYESVEFRSLAVALDECGVVESTPVRAELSLLPDAPPVRSVYVGHGNWEYSGSLTDQMDVVVDVASGISDSVEWWSTDTTVVVVDGLGRIRIRCRDTTGEAFVGANSVVDPTVRDSITIEVWPGLTGCT